jgi:hypothetical protein
MYYAYYFNIHVLYYGNTRYSIVTMWCNSVHMQEEMLLLVYTTMAKSRGMPLDGHNWRKRVFHCVIPIYLFIWWFHFLLFLPDHLFHNSIIYLICCNMYCHSYLVTTMWCFCRLWLCWLSFLKKKNDLCRRCRSCRWFSPTTPTEFLVLHSHITLWHVHPCLCLLLCYEHVLHRIWKSRVIPPIHNVSTTI